MIIRKVHLENIRSHENTSIELSTGINVIMGNTGSGKSSILMGIEYALFGKTSDNDNKILLRRNSSSGLVTLEFEENGKTITISRGLKRIKDSVRNDDNQNYIKVNNAPVNLLNRNEDLTSYIEKTIKMESENPIKTFEALTYIKQDELKTLILNESNEKQKLIDSILQLNKYQDTYDYMRELLKIIETKIEEGNKFLSMLNVQENVVKLESEIEETKSEIEKEENLVKEKIVEINDLKEKYNAEEKRNTELMIKKIKYQELSAKINEINNRISQIEKTIERINNENEMLSKKEIRTPEKSLEELTNLEKEFKNKLKELTDSIITTKTRISALEKEKQMKQNEIESLQKELTMYNKEMELINARINEIEKTLENPTLVYIEEINGRVAEIKEIIKELEEEKEEAIKTGICPICGNKADPNHLTREYDERINNMKSLIENYSKIKEDRRALEMELQKLKTKAESEQKNINENEERIKQINIKEIEEELEKKSKDLSEFEKNEKEINEILEKINADINAHLENEKILREIDANRKTIEELSKEKTLAIEEMGKIKEEVEALAFNQSELDNSNALLSQLRELEKQKENEFTAITKELEMKKLQLKKLEEEKEDYLQKMKQKEEYEERIRKLSDLYQLLNNLREDIRGIREYVRQKFLKDFSQYFKEKFDELRKDRDYELEIDSNYNIKVIAGNSELGINALSGGEKTLASLAYRIALSIVASRLASVKQSEVLIMDEPTVGLDREDLNTFVNALTGLRGINQIIIVTHEELFRNIADTLIEVKKEGGKSKVQITKNLY